MDYPVIGLKKCDSETLGRYARVAGSLKLGTVNATQLIQTLQRNGKPSMLGRAIGEFGRIFKTRHTLTFLMTRDIRDESLRS
jgi:TnpA family transposase